MVWPTHILTTGEDHLVGRYISPLNATEDLFATLPPPFGASAVRFPAGHSMETIFLHCHQVPATFHRVLPLLVATTTRG